MTIADFIKTTSRQLNDADIESARLDCLILLEDNLQVNRAYVLAHSEDEISASDFSQLQIQIQRRLKHEPLAYIRGHSAFFGRQFQVTDKVLIPRPETETMIELLGQLPLSDQNIRLADIGTGSGCLGITAALEIPKLNVDLYDISSEALDVARQNAAQLGASVGFFQSDLLQHLRHSYDILLANLPYVPEHLGVNRAATFEPRLALFSGSDGLDLYKTFWQQVAQLQALPRFILCESLPGQHHSIATLARHSGYALESSQGFIQVFSIL